MLDPDRNGVRLGIKSDEEVCILQLRHCRFAHALITTQLAAGFVQVVSSISVMRSFASAQDFGARLRRGASASTCVRAVGSGLRREQCLLTSNVIKRPQITLSSFSRANRLGFSPSPAPRRLDSDPFPLTKPRAEFSLHYFRRVIVANHHAVLGAPSPPPASPQGPRVRRSARSVTSQSANTSISRTIPSPPRYSPFPPLSGRSEYRRTRKG